MAVAIAHGMASIRGVVDLVALDAGTPCVVQLLEHFREAAIACIGDNDISRRYGAGRAYDSRLDT